MTAAAGDMRLAVADLGSNTFRLVVFTAHDAWWKRTDEVAESVRIGEGIAKTHELGEPGMARAQATMEVFAHFCAASGLDRGEIDAVATSAIRDADNAPAFLERETAYFIHNFDVDQAVLKSEHTTKLDELIAFLEEHPDARIVTITGRGGHAAAPHQSVQSAVMRPSTFGSVTVNVADSKYPFASQTALRP